MNESKLKKVGDRLARDPKVARHHFIIVNTDGTYLENWSGYGSNQKQYNAADIMGANTRPPSFSLLPLTDEDAHGHGSDGDIDTGGDGAARDTNADNGDGNG